MSFDEKSFDENIHALIRLSDTIEELQFTAVSLQGDAAADPTEFRDLLNQIHLMSLQRVSARLRVQKIREILRRRRRGVSYTVQSVQEEIQHLMNFFLAPQGVPARIILPKSIPLTPRQPLWAYQGYVVPGNGGYNIPVLELSQVQLESLASMYMYKRNGGDITRLAQAAMRVKFLKEVLEALNATANVPLTPPAAANILKPTTLRF